MIRLCQSVGILPLLLVLTGCGGDRYATAPAAGKVSYDGKAVSGGTITFIPINDDGSNREGKAALGAVGKDGAFILTTYEEQDGAILGKHRVVYTPPEGDNSEVEDAIIVNSEGEETVTEIPDKTGIQQELEVLEGSNTVDVKSEGNLFSIALGKAEDEEEEEE